MSKRIKRADDLFGPEKCSCSQAIAVAFADAAGLEETTAMNAARGFGGGIAGHGLTCGAVTGSIMILGVHAAQITTDEKSAKTRAYELAHQFTSRFLARHQTLECKKLIGVDLSTEAGRKLNADMKVTPPAVPRLRAHRRRNRRRAALARLTACRVPRGPADWELDHGFSVSTAIPTPPVLLFLPMAPGRRWIRLSWPSFAEGLAERGLRVARFEFPLHGRTAPQRARNAAPTAPAVLEDTWRAAIATLGDPAPPDHRRQVDGRAHRQPDRRRGQGAGPVVPGLSVPSARTPRKPAHSPPGDP